MDRVDCELNDIYCRKSFLNILIRVREPLLLPLLLSLSTTASILCQAGHKLDIHDEFDIGA